MTSFKELVKEKALQEKLPFDLDFEISPDFGDQPTEKVAGFDLPKFNELLSREAWFFELLGAQLTNRRQELQIAFVELADRLKEKINKQLEQQNVKSRIEYLDDAISLLENDVPDDCKEPKSKEEKERYKFYTWLLNSNVYKEFLVNNSKSFNHIGDLAKNVENNITVNWLKTTFFLCSRYSGEWTLGKTASLPKSKISEIVSFIEKETNGGNVPDNQEITAQEEQDVGKS